ncbi:MAG: ABC transporter permease [Clostridia bacterium]|nr:ABC transporter permease [Clostridia bacterium]
MAKDFERQAVSADGTRTIIANRGFSSKRFFLQWEWMLVLMLVAVNIFNISSSSNYANARGILNATRDFIDKAIVVFPMAFVLMLGEIDISVASIMALSATIMGIVFEATGNMFIAIIAALLTGVICGLINGSILAKFPELSSMIVTLSTQIIFRGIAQIILETRSIGGFPSWFGNIASGKVGLVPYGLIFVVAEAVFFAYLLHMTKFGRRTIAMGNSVTVAKYSGIKTNKIKVIIFTVVGLFSAIAGIYLSSKMSSVRSDVARGYELDIIAMVVLGGISTSGGRGRILGTSLAILVIGYLRYGLGLINATSQIIMIVVGLLLIIAVAIPNLKNSLGQIKILK